MLLGYMVVTATTLVTLGRLSDVFGRVRLYNLGFAIFTLVLLRLVIGWHFFGEGMKKLQYDRHTGRFAGPAMPNSK